MRGTALARSWEDLLKLMAEVALRPTLPDEEIERERRLIQSAIQTRGDTPFQRAFDSLLVDLYGPHPVRVAEHRHGARASSGSIGSRSDPTTPRFIARTGWCSR